MGAVKLLDKEITQYLGQLSVPQKEVVLSVIKSFTREEIWWDDKAYITEMDKRFAEMENGKVKSVSLDDLEIGVRQSYKKAKQRKQ